MTLKDWRLAIGKMRFPKYSPSIITLDDDLWNELDALIGEKGREFTYEWWFPPKAVKWFMFDGIIHVKANKKGFHPAYLAAHS